MSLRVGKMAEKARNAAAGLKATGMKHQKALSECGSFKSHQC